MTIHHVSPRPLEVCCMQHKRLGWAILLAGLACLIWAETTTAQMQILTPDGTTLHLAGTISNADTTGLGLAKYGLGTLVLSGNNTYGGNTLLYEGSLQIAGNSALGNHTLDIFQGTSLSYAAGATLYNPMQLRPHPDPTSTPPSDSLHWLVASGAATQAGTANGSVPVIKQGAGTLYLMGFGFNTALTTVAQGTLAVGNFMAGPVQVNAGARLAGPGTIQHITVQPGGTLAPGMTPGDIDTLMVIGDLNLHSGAVLEADVDARGRADLVQVLGIARLNGQVRAMAGAGPWQPHTDYTLLHAAGGLDDTRFTSVSSNMSFLTPSLSYDAEHVYLRLDRNDTPLDEVADTPTEKEVADAIDTEDNPDVYDKVIVMDKDQAKEAYRQLSGSWHASVLSGIVEDSRFVRQAALFNTPRGLVDHGPSGRRFWGQAFHSDGHRQDDKGAPADKRKLNGLVLGVSHPISDSLHANAYIGMQDSRMRRDRAMATARVSTLHAGAALGGNWAGAAWAVGAAHSWHRIQSHRNLAVAGLRDALSSGYRGRTMQGFAELVAPVRWMASTLQSLSAEPQRLLAEPTLAPFARVAWVHSQLGEHTEDGGSAALAVRAARSSVVFSKVGLQASHPVHIPGGEATIKAELAWRHAGGSTDTVSRQAFRDGITRREFTSYGHPVARQAWSLQLGLDATWHKHRRLIVGYAGQYATGRQDHGARLNLKWGF